MSDRMTRAEREAVRDKAFSDPVYGPALVLGGLNIKGVKGQALTLETTGAPAATSSATVAMTGYSLSEAV